MKMSRIIPAIDIIDGKCVRLKKGDYTRKTIYADDPLRVAREFEDAGINYLHLVDLDGAKAGKVVNIGIIEAICSQTKLKVDMGGGIKSDDDIRKVFDSGVNQVNIGSLAVKNPDLLYSWIDTYGSDKIILSADVRDEKIAIHGWQTLTDIHIEAFIEGYLQKGIRSVVCTDISKDGMMQGPSLELYQQLMGRFPELDLIASGGVSSIDDVKHLIDMELDGIIIGKAIYEGKITLNQLSNVNKKNYPLSGHQGWSNCERG